MKKKLTKKEKIQLTKNSAWKQFYETKEEKVFSINENGEKVEETVLISVLTTQKLSQKTFEAVNQVRQNYLYHPLKGWIKKKPLKTPFINQNALPVYDRGKELIGKSFYSTCKESINKILK